MTANASLEDCILTILERVSGTSEVRANLDIALFDAHILDSFDVMSVIVELSDALNVDISPAEVERSAWATPRKIIAYMQNRLGN